MPDRLQHCDTTNYRPEYAKSIIRADEPIILTIVTDDDSGTVCFDEFTQDTWVQLVEAETVTTPTVDN